MNTFPLDFSKHIVFCAISVALFLIQYYRQGFKYQLLTAGAIGATLLLYLNDSKAWSYGIGALELVLIIIIIVLMSVEKKKAALEVEKGKNTEADNSITENAEPSAESDESKNEQ